MVQSWIRRWDKKELTKKRAPQPSGLRLPKRGIAGMSTPAWWRAIWGRAKARAQALPLVTSCRISFLTGLAKPPCTTSTQQQYQELRYVFGRRRHESFQTCEATTTLCSLPASLDDAPSGHGHVEPRFKNGPSPMVVRERIMEC